MKKLIVLVFLLVIFTNTNFASAKMYVFCRAKDRMGQTYCTQIKHMRVWGGIAGAKYCKRFQKYFSATNESNFYFANDSYDNLEHTMRSWGCTQYVNYRKGSKRECMKGSETFGNFYGELYCAFKVTGMEHQEQREGVKIKFKELVSCDKYERRWERACQKGFKNFMKNESLDGYPCRDFTKAFSSHFRDYKKRKTEDCKYLYN